MKNNEIITFRFVEGGDCDKCCFETVKCGYDMVIGHQGSVLDCRGGHFELVKPEPAFDARLGQLTDEDARKGNPMGGRVHVVYESRKVFQIEELLQVFHFAGRCILSFRGWVRIEEVPLGECRLATPEELQSEGIDPREAGVKE